MISPPLALFEQQYKTAAGDGAVYELRIRLLADKITSLQHAAYDDKLENVESLIIAHFDDLLSDAEKMLLKGCRQLRNKVLHCDFTAARDKLRSVGANPIRADVKRIDIGGLTGPQMTERIAAAGRNSPGAFEFVADTPQKVGAVFGWLMELGAAGDFDLAADSFRKATAIVERLAEAS